MNDEHDFLGGRDSHPIFDDEELFHQMWEGPLIIGHVDKVFVPTREELLVLLKHWYKVVREENYFLSLSWSSDWHRRRSIASSRLGLIEKFLSEEEVEEVFKEVRDEEQKDRKTDTPTLESCGEEKLQDE